MKLKPEHFLSEGRDINPARGVTGQFQSNLFLITVTEINILTNGNARQNCT